MRIFQDKDGRYLVLLPEIWKHVVEGHPEVEKHLGNIAETLARPLIICRSRKNEERHLYYGRFRNKLFFAVVVDISKGIIKTCYISDRIKEGEILWREKK